MKNTIFNIFLILLFIVVLPGGAVAETAGTPAGVKIIGVAEAEFLNGEAFSNKIQTIVPQIYGLAISQLNLYAAVTKGEPYYFPHQVENIGNGTDQVSLKAVDLPAGWRARFIIDDNKNGFHDKNENKELIGKLKLSEGAVGHFFLEITANEEVKTGSIANVKIQIISSGRDGPAYLGSNGKIYGGDDEVSTTDRAMAL